MSGIQPSTYITLERHFDSRINALEKELLGLMDEREKSRDKVAQALEKQVDITREAYDRAHNLLIKDINDLMLSRANVEGKASMNSVYISYLISVLAILVSVWLRMK